jgi:hypothetical protein
MTNGPPILKECSPPIAGAYGGVQVVEAFANYFKHSSEWRADWGNPKGKPAKAIPVLVACGASQFSTGNFRSGAKAMGNEEFWKVQVFADLLRKWRAALSSLHEAELGRLGLI